MSITPLGSPVVPPVPTSIARSSSRSAAACVGARRRASASSSSRQTFSRHVELLDHRRVAGVVDQALAVEELEQRAVLGHLVARVDRAPHRAAAGDAEHARERDGVVASEDPDLAAGLDAVARERARDAVAEVLHVAVGQRAVALDQAGRVAAERRALVQVVGERAHRASHSHPAVDRQPERR